MHKALAQAWRDLKPEGQKPYFEEYERHKASYTAKVNELRDNNSERDVGRQQRAASVGSSVAAAPSFDEQAGAGSNTNDEDGDEIMGGAAGDADFSFSSSRI
jgi:non-histone protein 10